MVKTNNLFLKSKEKGISEIITLVLVILVSTILIGMIFTWARSDTKEKLDTSTQVLRQASDLECSQANIKIDECTIDFFEKKVDILINNKSNINLFNIKLTIQGKDYDNNLVKIVGSFDKVIPSNSISLLSSDSNYFSYEKGDLFTNNDLNVYTITNFTIVSGACPNKAIELIGCDVIDSEDNLINLENFNLSSSKYMTGADNNSLVAIDLNSSEFLVYDYNIPNDYNLSLSAWVKIPKVKAKDVAVGSVSVCVILDDNSVRCWGYNQHGEVGNGTVSSASENYAIDYPIVSSITNVKEIQAGYYHFCATVNDDNSLLKCWGYNADGEMGDNSTTPRATPITIDFNLGIKYLHVNYYNTCVILEDNTLKCWGYNGYGQLGTGNTTNKLVPYDINNNVSSVGVGLYHICYSTLVDGNVYCSGYNAVGSLGNNSTTNSNVFVKAQDINGVVNLSAGAYHTCAVKSNGNVYCWGRNSEYEYGNNTTTQSLIPINTGITDINYILPGGFYQSIAYSNSGVYKYWGYNGSATLGDGTSSYSRTPTSLSTSISKPNMGDGFLACYVYLDGKVNCAGAESYKSLGNGMAYESLNFRLIKNLINNSDFNDVNFMISGLYTLCAMLNDKNVICVGHNTYGQVGDATKVYKTYPAYVSNLNNVKKISAGVYHFCAWLDNNTVKCWGYNGHGEMGDNTTTDRTTPILAQNLSNVIDLDSEYYHTCAVISDGTAKCWGNNGNSQIGDGTYTVAKIPTSVIGLTNAIKISTGYIHTCALLGTGNIKCWGKNNYGQLGNGTTTDSNVIVDVNGINNAIDISCGNYHCCTLLSDSTVKCWGANSNYQLGDGTGTNRSSPVNVIDYNNSILSGIISIKSNSSINCGLLANKTIKCWGYAGNGQFGMGTTSAFSKARDIGQTNIKDYFLGYFNVYLILEDGNIYGTGGIHFNQLGLATPAWSYGLFPVMSGYIIGKDKLSFGILHNFGENNTISAYLSGNTIDYNLPNDIWTHLALTYDYNKLRLYSNSSLVGYYDLKTKINDFNSGLNILKGVDGQISDIRIFNETLTANDIRAIYEHGIN